MSNSKLEEEIRKACLEVAAYLPDDLSAEEKRAVLLMIKAISYYNYRDPTGRNEIIINEHAVVPIALLGDLMMSNECKDVGFWLGVFNHLKRCNSPEIRANLPTDSWDARELLNNIGIFCARFSCYINNGQFLDELFMSFRSRYEYCLPSSYFEKEDRIYIAKLLGEDYPSARESKPTLISRILFYISLPFRLVIAILALFILLIWESFFPPSRKHYPHEK